MSDSNDVKKNGNQQTGEGAASAAAAAKQQAGASAATKPPAKPIPDKPLVTAQTPPDKKKLVGQNYVTPDMIAKVTGRSKYAEDYRADGMLFTKLLLSPYPHARITAH